MEDHDVVVTLRIPFRKILNCGCAPEEFDTETYAKEVLDDVVKLVRNGEYRVNQHEAIVVRPGSATPFNPVSVPEPMPRD